MQAASLTVNTFSPFTGATVLTPHIPFLAAGHQRGRTTFGSGMKHKIDYSAVVDVLYWGYNWEPCKVC
jgi:hypothetical protein